MDQGSDWHEDGLRQPNVRPRKLDFVPHFPSSFMVKSGYGRIESLL